MAEPAIRFDDGAAYERVMGVWSRLVGEVFLDWLAPPAGLRWIEAGCGNGAFTELLIQRCAPAAVQAIDPSEGQLAFARSRPGTRLAQYQLGVAQALPVADKSFDAAVMALVIFFVPEPSQGVAEMVRAVRPGGIVATYGWDLMGGGFPWDPIQAEVRALGLPVVYPPSPDAAGRESLPKLWRDAGLEAVETREITVHRRFADFDEFWDIAQRSPGTAATLAGLPPTDAASLKTRVRARLGAGETGPITTSARANAVKGRVQG